MTSSRSFPLACLALFGAVLIWSGVRPYDRFTWLLEVAPALIGAVVLVASYQRLRLTNLLYGLILLHAVVLCVGGHYTYALVPLGQWAKELFSLSRNNYDKLGHLMQGFVPALIARELFVRLKVFQRERWIPFVILSVSLAISAFYELIEWWVSLATGSEGDAFLGTQGYVWDTQSDMGYAFLGAGLALLLSRRHNQQIDALESSLPV